MWLGVFFYRKGAFHMKKLLLEPFFFQAGKRAVLLLHGFTGSSADVRQLGRYLEKKGYTSIAPHYKGHGVAPEQLITTGPKDWWQSVQQAYQTLKDEGYEQIAVVGLSLGGVLSLKLSMNEPILGVVTMCAPMTMRSTDVMFEGVVEYAEHYKKFEGKDEATIQQEIAVIKQQGMPTLADLRNEILQVNHELDMVYAPIFVVQATQDEVINPQSATMIYEGVASDDKSIKWYEQSKHVITLGPEKEQLHEDIYAFLEKLPWHM